MRNYEFIFNIRNSKLEILRKPISYNSDKNNFKITLSLIDGTKLKTIELDNCITRLSAVKPCSKEYVEIDGEINGGKFEFILDERFNNQVGEYMCEFKIIEGDKVITSESFIYTVNPSVLYKLSEELENDPDIFILKRLIDDVKTFNEDVTNLKNALLGVSEIIGGE